jgi:hypothetical protein
LLHRLLHWCPGSPVKNRFDEKDEQLLLKIAEIFIHSLG